MVFIEQKYKLKKYNILKVCFTIFQHYAWNDLKPCCKEN